MFRLSHFLFLLTPLLLASCDELNLGEKKDKFSITVHSQGGDMESPRTIFRMPLPGRSTPVVFKLVPEFSQHNIAAFHSFPAADGNGNGVTLKLDFRGAESLNMASRTRFGEVLLAMVNGQPVDYVSIDRPVSDGIFTIWEGVPDSVVAEMTKKYPPINKLKSMSTGQEMLPTTRGEKKRSMKAVEDERKFEEQQAKKKAADEANPSATPPKAERVTDNGLPAGAATKKVVPPENGMRDKPLPSVQR